MAAVPEVNIWKLFRPPAPVTDGVAQVLSPLKKVVALGVPDVVAKPVDGTNPDVLVKVPELGVPSAPPFTTNDPAVPTLTPRADATPVPRPETPVDIGKPVQLVSVPELGVPRAPLKVTKAPADPTLIAKAVATPVPKPVNPDIGKPVALVRVREAGVPIARPLGRVVLMLGTPPAEVTKNTIICC